MKAFRFYFFSLLWMGMISLQAQTASATYTGGDLDMEGFDNNGGESSCSDTLVVTIPAGSWVYSTSVSYTITSTFGNNNQQRSYLECTSTGVKESQVFAGSNSTSFPPPPQVYNRTNLSIANGLSVNGQVKFYLHAMSEGFFTCSNFFATVPNNSWTVTVVYGPPPACLPPGSLTVTSTGPGSVGLSWTGAPGNFTVEYGPTGFILGAGTQVATSNNSIVLNGLVPNSEHQFYVRRNCSPTSISLFSGPVAATPECLPLNTPYFEDFESGFEPALTFGGQPTIDPCYERDFTQNYFWTPGPPQFPGFLTGPSGDHTTGNGNYMYTDPLNTFNTNTNAYLETPLLDLTSLTTPQLTFWYHMYGSQISDLKVQVVQGSVVTTILTVTGQQQTASTNAWKRSKVSLASYANDTIKLRFVGSRLSGFTTQSEIAIDDIGVDELTTCTDASAITTSNITNTSVQLNWTSTASSWVVKYFPVGNPAAAQYVSATAKPFTVTGLSPSTSYTFQVKDSCGIGSTGLWSDGVQATTLCGPKTAPFTETFDGTEWPIPIVFNDAGVVQSCWTRSNTSEYFWRTGNANSTVFTTTGPDKDHTSGNGKFLFTRAAGFFGVTTTQTTLNSYFINLVPLDTPELRFWYHMYGTNIDELDVLIRVGTNTPIPVLNLTGQQQTSQSQNWKEAVVDLSPFIDDTIRVIFRARRLFTNSNLNEIAIDDLTIQEKPRCPKVTPFQNTFVSDVEAAFTWSDPGGTSWIIEYGPPGFTPGTGTVWNATSIPDTITGLTPGTTYEFYIRRACSGTTFNWTGPRTVTTLPCANACFYTLNMSASFFNGWNGGVVKLSSGAFSQNFTLVNQTSATISFPVCDGEPFSLQVINVGTFPAGIGFVLKNELGTTLYTHVAGNFLSTGVKYAIVGACGGICEPPKNLGVSNITGSTATLTWTSSASTWIEYGPVGFVPGTGTIVTPGPSTSPLLLSGLLPNTSYQAYFRDSCTTQPASTRVGPITFTTLNCSSVTANFTSVEVGLTATCNAATSTSISEYAWDFGDGATGSGSTASHGYAADGTYVIKLVVENLCGQKDSILKTITVCAPLSGPSIGVSPVGLSVGYTSGVITGTPVQYFWNFGDNTASTGANPSHTYTIDGTYNVTLIVVNLCGDSVTTTTTVEVCSVALPQFTIQQTGNSIVVDGWGTPGAAGLTFTWDFGDGNTGSGPIANHTYGSPGTYVVTMEVVNSCGEAYSTTQTVKVCQPPIVDFTFKVISTGGNGMLVEFDASASQGASGYLWNFGDGNTSTVGPIVQHLYVTPGLFYVVKLTLTDTCGTNRSDTKSLASFGVSGSDQTNLILYPNPVQGTDAILAGWKGQVDSFQAMNALGQVMGQVTTKMTAEGLVIACAQWPAGVYMIYITGPDQVFTGQLVIGSR